MKQGQQLSELRWKNRCFPTEGRCIRLWRESRTSFLNDSGRKCSLANLTSLFTCKHHGLGNWLRCLWENMQSFNTTCWLIWWKNPVITVLLLTNLFCSFLSLTVILGSLFDKHILCLLGQHNNNLIMLQT